MEPPPAAPAAGAPARAREEATCPAVRAGAQLRCYPRPGSGCQPPFIYSHSLSNYCVRAGLSCQRSLRGGVSVGRFFPLVSWQHWPLGRLGGGVVGKGARATSRATGAALLPCGEALMRTLWHILAKAGDASVPGPGGGVRRGAGPAALMDV